MNHSITITQDLKGILVKCSCGCKVIDGKNEISLTELTEQSAKHYAKAMRATLKG
jgi:hypothetical protein